MQRKFTVCLAILALASSALAVALPSRAQEETGVEPAGQKAATPGKKATLSSRMGPVLLIPESTGDVVGMYSPVDGTYQGDLIVDDSTGTNYNLQTPKHAVQGPDGNIYVADQVSDAVYVFDTTGAFVQTYCSGYNNLRGIAFRGDHLFITSGDGYVAEFSGPNTFLRNFIQDGSDPFDIHFLPDGRALLSDIAGTTDNVRLYDTNGVFIAQIFPISFPQQIQADTVLPGAFLNAAFSSNVITDFGLDSVIAAQFPYNGGRGVYRLGNGNLLATSASGVQELDSLTGAVVETERTGSGQYIELFHYVVPLHGFGEVDTTINITGPGDYTLAGITFCSADSNFYFVSMNDDSVYRLDPDDWSCAPAFAVDNGAGEIPWGISWDGSHFWVGQLDTSMSYTYDKQYTFAGAYTGTYYNATGIGGSSWMGAMDHNGTHTWQLAVGGSNKLYKLDLPGGTLVDSIPSVFWGTTSQRACCWIPWTSQFISGGWNSGQLYLVDTLGQEVAGSPALGSVADVDIYDFVNEGQELWGLVTINTSPNTIHKVWLGITKPTGVEGGPSAPLVGRALSLMPNFPNPVRGRTNISFNLPKAGAYELRVYNIAGQMVDRITGQGQAGANRLTWNAGRLAAGVYLYAVSSNEQSATRKLVVVR